MSETSGRACTQWPGPQIVAAPARGHGRPAGAGVLGAADERRFDAARRSRRRRRARTCRPRELLPSGGAGQNERGVAGFERSSGIFQRWSTARSTCPSRTSPSSGYLEPPGNSRAIHCGRLTLEVERSEPPDLGGGSTRCRRGERTERASRPPAPHDAPARGRRPARALRQPRGRRDRPPALAPGRPGQVGHDPDRQRHRRVHAQPVRGHHPRRRPHEPRHPHDHPRRRAGPHLAWGPGRPHR